MSIVRFVRLFVALWIPALLPTSAALALGQLSWNRIWGRLSSEPLLRRARLVLILIIFAYDDALVDGGRSILGHFGEREI